MCISSEMGNLLFSSFQLGGDFFEKPSHGLLSVKHCPDFFVACNVVLDFLLQWLVQFFVFENAHQTLIDLWVQDFVFACQIVLLFSESLSLQDCTIKFAFGCPQGVVQALQLLGEILVLGRWSLKFLAELFVLLLGFVALFLQLQVQLSEIFGLFG